jgi:hypothetical protein
MSQAIHIVFVDCLPEIEEKYNEWYNNVHIPMIMKYSGILGATRYKLLDGPQGQSRYFTVYEFRDQQAMESFPESPEFAAVDKELHKTWKGPEFTVKLAAKYEVMKTWAKK